jgi:hypothetical protein
LFYTCLGVGLNFKPQKEMKKVLKNVVFFQRPVQSESIFQNEMLPLPYKGDALQDYYHWAYDPENLGQPVEHADWSYVQAHDPEDEDDRGVTVYTRDKKKGWLDPHPSFYRPGHRILPVDQVEDALKRDGILPYESEGIPHFDMSNSTQIIVKPKAKGKKPQSQKPKAKPKKKSGPAVRMVTSGYPAVDTSLVGSSVSLSAPTGRGLVNRSGKPRVNYSNNGDVIISNKALLMDVSGSTPFSVFPLAINPGLPSFELWLSKIAANYESYKFLSLEFFYEPEAATSATGSIILAIDYDAGDSAPTTKAQICSYRSTVRCAPWTPCVHRSLHEDLNKRCSYFVRAGGIPPGKDINLYDVGNLYIGTVGQGGTIVIGEIWVRYTIKLMTPRSLSAGGGNAVWGLYDPIDNTNICNYTSGNLPATVTSSGTTSAKMTAVFNQPWQGVVTFDLSGTSLAVATYGGTAIRTDPWSVVNGGTTQLVGHVTVNAIPGQDLQITIPNATITTGSNNGFYFMQGTGAYQ